MRKTKEIEIKEVDGQENGSYDITISTQSVDRQGDIVMLDGWDFDNYLKNPVVMLNHDYGGLPVGKTNNLRVKGGALVANFSFLQPANDNDPINFVKNAWDQGALRAASVGFRPIEAEQIDPDSDSWWPEMRFLEQELLEWSIVTIPANPEATRLMFKGFAPVKPSEAMVSSTERVTISLGNNELLTMPKGTSIFNQVDETEEDTEVARLIEAVQTFKDLVNDTYEVKEGDNA